MKIIYIVGAGRSGSTVLGTIMGAGISVENAGEVVNVPRCFASSEEYCACGKLVSSCRFWDKVKKEWIRMSDLKDLQDLRSLQCSYERVRNLPYLLISQLLNTNRYKQYLDNTLALYQSVARVSGNQIIVDSSKSPIRFLALSKIRGVDFRALHLVRDGRAVTWSLLKSYKKDPKSGVQHDIKKRSAWRTAVFWVLINLLTELFVRHAADKKFLRVKYEDLVEEAGGFLQELGDFVGVDYQVVSDTILKGGGVSVGHPVAGNRVRMSTDIRLKPDYAWHDSLTRKDAITFWSIAGFLSAIYGYKRKLKP